MRQFVRYLVICLALILTACSGGSGSDSSTPASFTVSVSINNVSGGSVNPSTPVTVASGQTTTINISPITGYTIGSATGCNGSLSGTNYTTGPVLADCQVQVNFILVTAAASPLLTFTQVKNFRFTWSDQAGATHYRLLENADGNSGFTQVGSDIAAGVEVIDHIVPLFNRINAQYILQTCFNTPCNDSSIVSVAGTLEASIGYIKASNPDADDNFIILDLSEDGTTLAVGAPSEDSNSTGINGDQTNNAAVDSGAVYVFVRNGLSWEQQAYIKASNAEAGDEFGISVSLSADGNTLAVGAQLESSNATGVNGDQTNNAALDSGAAYVFTRNANVWTQEAYIKSSNSESFDVFGLLHLSGDGNTLAVGANSESSGATGVNGNQADNSVLSSGAVYIYVRSAGVWSQQAYIKASNPDMSDGFGWAVSLSSNGNTLAVGVDEESSSATGINGNQADNTASRSGAVYVFTRTGIIWAQQAYIKASNSSSEAYFGEHLDVSADGNTLAVGAPEENSNAVGVGGDQTNSAASSSGAVYVFTRSGSVWSQQAYIKASNTGANDFFGTIVSLSSDGNILVASAFDEDSNAVGINGDQTDNSAPDAGAAYIFVRDATVWRQQAYIKASNTDALDNFAFSVISGDGRTLAVGAPEEGGTSAGVGGDQSSNTASGVGAVYIY